MELTLLGRTANSLSCTNSFVAEKQRSLSLHSAICKALTGTLFLSDATLQWAVRDSHQEHQTSLSRIVGNVKLTFEELNTVLTQIKACLNSRPLTSLPSDDDILQVLTPGHFLIGRLLESLPNPSTSECSISLFRRWELCQLLVQHFWRQWLSEYLTALQKLQKWRTPTCNLSVDDIVVIKEDRIVPLHWPLARTTQVHSGRDGVVRMVTVETNTGIYKHPAHKVALILPGDSAVN